MKLRFRILAVIVICLSIPAFFYGVLAAKEGPGQIIKKEIAKANGIPIKNLEVAYEEYTPLPLTNKGYTYAKVIEKKTGKGYEGATDKQGNIIDHEVLNREEKAAHRAKYGKLHPSLYKHLQDKDSDEKVKVVFWLDMGGTDLGIKKPTPEEARAMGRERIEELKLEVVRKAEKLHGEIARPLIAEIERAGSMAKAGKTAPVVSAELPKSAIEKLAGLPIVDTIFYDRVRDKSDVGGSSQGSAGKEFFIGPQAPETTSAYAETRQTIKADVALARGMTGTGYQLGVFENTFVATNHPCLTNSDHTVIQRACANPLGCDFSGEHATGVAGFIAATQCPTIIGTAPGVESILSADTGLKQSDLDDGSQWFTANGADAVNNSWGTKDFSDPCPECMQLDDYWADYWVRNSWTPYVAAAGNLGATGFIAHPGLGFNVLTVGSIDDKYTADWSDDTITGLSSGNKVSGRRKPEVAAIGCNDGSDDHIWWLINDPAKEGSGTCGTSFATPMVTGMMATLQQRDSGLEVWPEAVKAITIASAMHPVDPLDSRDGAGSIDMAAADYIAANGWWAAEQVDETDFDADGDMIIPIGTLYAGETLRVAMAYDSLVTKNVPNTNPIYLDDVLQGDLDIYLVDSSGNLLGPSGTTKDSWEMFEATIAQTGSYSILVHNYSLDPFAGSEWTYMGLAWWKGHYALEVATQTRGTPTSADDHYRVDTSSSPDWWAVAMRPPAGGDYDLYLYDESQYGNPTDFVRLGYSNRGGDVLDIVVIDRNHAPAKSYYPIIKNYQMASSGDYNIKRAVMGGELSSGAVSLGTAPGFMTMVWDVPFDAGVTKYIRVVPTSGDADPGLLLFDSNLFFGSSLYQDAGQAVRAADLSGAGGAEELAYTSGEYDTLGLVLYHKRGQTTVADWTLYVDDSAPSGTISINGGDPYTVSKFVDLTLACTDTDTGCTEMRFSNNGADWSTWVPYSTSQTNWPLCTDALCEGGIYTVYVQYKNGAGMVSPSFSDTIIWDFSAPSGSLAINGGDPYTNSGSVTLDTSCADSESGCAEMRFSNNGTDWSTWVPYSTSQTNWPLCTDVFCPGGTYTVYAQYKNGAGMVSASFSDTIVWDFSAPSGSILINGGDTETASTAVTLTLSCTDGFSGCDTMRFSNDDTSWSAWESYAATKAWNLTSGAGVKTVYVQYQDGAGNTSASFSDDIVLQTTYALQVTKAGTGSGTVTSNPPGINCGPDCSEPYVSGTPVTLTATPDAGSTFGGWSGDPDCTDGAVTMDSPKSCTAAFDTVPLPDLIVQSIATNPVSPAPGEVTGVTVTVKNQGAGEAVRAFSIDFYKDRPSAPGASDSGDVSCLRSGLGAGATVACTWGVSYASPGTYKMWAQVDTGENVEESDEENNILGPQEIDVSLPTFVLSVTKAGTGQGTVTSNPSGIDCGADCSEPYEEGTPVTLTATPDTGATFVGFSGDPDCTDATVTVDGAKSCTATFDDTTAPPIPQNVTLDPTDVDKATLSWDASADTGGSGVSGYRVYDTRTGALVSETAQLSADLSGLAAEVSYFVKAYDAAGNVSDRSRFAGSRLPVRFYWQMIDIPPGSGKTFAANPAGGTAKASFIFEGEEVKINYGCGLNTGIFEVSIDGALVDTVDAYCSTPDFSAQKTYVTAPGGHTIEVRPTGNTNPSSSYYWTLIDSFEVAGEKYEEDDGVSYTWQTVDILGSTFSANPAGGTAYVSFTYAGDNVSLNYGCGLNTGIFDVEIDGVLTDTVDAYCSPPDFSAKKTYPSALGIHTIEVRPTGLKNNSSSYYWTLIDSFEAGGNIFQAQALPQQEAEELSIPDSRLSKLLQRLPKPIRERIEKRLEKVGGIASAETISLLNSEKLTRLLERLEGKRDE